MSLSDHLASCEALVRKVDYDRYLAALFAPAQARPHLLALYAFNYEIAKTGESVSEPVLGQIRLQWWREAIEDVYAGRARAHEVVQPLAAAVAAHDLPRGLFEALIEAREKDLEDAPFAQEAELISYAEATSGHLMRLAARILGAGDRLDAAARDAGIAYALTGALRALPFHAARGRLMLPAEALGGVRLSQEQVFSGAMDEKVTALIARMAARAREHLKFAQRTPIPRAVLPALLPAALVRIYLNVMTRAQFNPFRDSTEVPVHRRQLAMLGAMVRRRL